jgi:signal transduction histidine kinase
VDSDGKLDGFSERLCILAHDLNNGLGVIAGHCQLLAEHPGIDEECARRLRIMLETVDHLASKINGHDCRMVSCAARGSEFATPSRPDLPLVR